MSGEARSWLNLLVVVFVVLGLISLMVCLRASAADRRRLWWALALVWTAVLGTFAGGWAVRRLLGGPLLEVNLFGAPELLVKAPTPPELVALIAGLVLLVALYVLALLALRRLMIGLPPTGPGADDEGDAQ